MADRGIALSDKSCLSLQKTKQAFCPVKTPTQKNCGNTNTIRQNRRKIDLAVLVVGIPEYDRLVAAYAITQDGIVLDRCNMRTVPVEHIETNRILLNMDVTTADSYKRCCAKGVRLCRNRDLWI